MVRHPAVAGQFYSSDPDRLREELASLVPPGEGMRVIGVVAPHAGYLYSGRAAGLLYGRVRVPEAVLIIGPNHTGLGLPVALAPAGEWLTPLGGVPVNTPLCQLILKHAPQVREDAAAHRVEHSIEVQLPFLCYRNPRVSIAALCLSRSDDGSLASLGAGIARAVAAYGGEVLIVASSDMTHYESAAAAKEKDDLALSRLALLDPDGLLKVCREKRISMCGQVPAAVMLVAAKLLGATASSLVCYTTSGEVTGDLTQVVAYAAVTVS